MKLLFQPLKPFIINQRFGANKACITTDGTRKVITCDGNNPPNGYKSLYGKYGHGGIDCYAHHGQPLFAAQDGVVYHIDTSKKSGLDVRIESEVNGVKFRHIYEHLMSYEVQVGQKVRVGQLIGRCDNTGYSSGDHLHFEMRIQSNDVWKKVDPLEYMEDIYAPDFLKIIDQFAYLKVIFSEWLAKQSYKLRKNI